MRRRGLCACLALAGCGEQPPELVPHARIVDRIERALAGRECIGALDRWQRVYVHPWRADPATGKRGPVADVIMFDFSQAGVHGFKAGRIRAGKPPTALDHRQYRTAFGRYEVATGRLTLESCGWNCPADVPPGGGCG